MNNSPIVPLRDYLAYRAATLKHAPTSPFIVLDAVRNEVEHDPNLTWKVQTINQAAAILGTPATWCSMGLLEALKIASGDERDGKRIFDSVLQRRVISTLKSDEIRLSPAYITLLEFHDAHLKDSLPFVKDIPRDNWSSRHASDIASHLSQKGDIYAMATYAQDCGWSLLDTDQHNKFFIAGTGAHVFGAAVVGSYAVANLLMDLGLGERFTEKAKILFFQMDAANTFLALPQYEIEDLFKLAVSLFKVRGYSAEKTASLLRDEAEPFILDTYKRSADDIHRRTLRPGGKTEAQRELLNVISKKQYAHIVRPKDRHPN